MNKHNSHLKMILLTLLLLAITLVIFEFSSVDLMVQNLFYDADQQQWLLQRDQQPWRWLLYDGIKRLFVLGVLTLAVAFAAFRKRPWFRPHRNGLLTVLLSCIIVPLVIASLKTATNVPCPKDIEQYNGPHPHITVFSRWPQQHKPDTVMRCYPAAHASGGFALLSLFFLFQSRRKRLLAVAFALGIGWSTGLYKMLIGDHFLSHTIVSMLIAWLMILLIHTAVTYRDNTRYNEHQSQT